MSYKDILVYVDNRDVCESRIRFATDLAQRFDCRLTGLYTQPELFIPAHVGVSLPPQLLENLEQTNKKDTERAKALFEHTVRDANLNSDWHFARGNIKSLVSAYARYCDLVIISQDDAPTIEFDTAFADDMILECPRPVLLLPYIGPPKTVGERILVAWNGSREAVRAVHEALPLLKAASSVVVLSINKNADEEQESVLSTQNMCMHLARHGVNADAKHETAPDIDVGNKLLSSAADHQADLIVMGAYGHSRFRERLLGGATKALLDHMTVPVLMTH